MAGLLRSRLICLRAVSLSGRLGLFALGGSYLLLAK